MICDKCKTKMRKIDLRFISAGPYKFAYECPKCEEKGDNKKCSAIKT